MSSCLKRNTGLKFSENNACKPNSQEVNKAPESSKSYERLWSQAFFAGYFGWICSFSLEQPGNGNVSFFSS